MKYMYAISAIIFNILRIFYHIIDKKYHLFKVHWNLIMQFLETACYLAVQLTVKLNIVQ